MILGRERTLRKELIETGRRLYQRRLVAARSGNLSCRLNSEAVFITSTGSSLGELRNSDIIKANISRPEGVRNPKLSSEFPLHRLIHQRIGPEAVIHCHPPLVNAYFAVCPSLEILTFETKLYLGSVPLVNQDTPAITELEPVMEGLKLSNIVAIKNHGVVALGKSFTEALHLIEMLEEAVRVAAVARLFKKEKTDQLDQGLKEALKEGAVYEIFSREHIQAIVELVNRDEFIAKKGKELNLTLKLAIRLDETGQAYKFNFQEGRIAGLDFDQDAPFVISAPRAIWEQVFLGKLDSFVAVTQGKMKLQGQLGQLSRWYVPFTRLFALFKEVRIK